MLQKEWLEFKHLVKDAVEMLRHDKRISLFLFSVIIGPGLSYSVVYFFHLMSAYLVIHYGLKWIRTPKIINHLKQPTPFYGFFFFMVGWFLLSTVWATDTMAALYFTVYLILGSFIALSVSWYVKNRQQLKYVLTCIALFLTLEILVSLLEVLTPFRWPISRYSFLLPYFGRPPYLTPEVLSDLLQTATPQYIFSLPTGFQWNPNNLSAVMCLLFPYALIMKNQWMKLIFTVSIITLVVAASARLGFMALCLILVLYLLTLAPKLKIFPKLSFSGEIAKRNATNWFLILLLSFLATDGFYYICLDNKKIHDVAFISGCEVPHTELWTSNSVKVRVQLLQQGWKLFKDSNGLGVGAGNSKSLIAAQGGVGKEKLNDLHFFWLELLVDGGVLFFLGFAFWYLAMMKRLFDISRKLDDELLGSLSMATCIGLIGFGIAGISPSSAVYLLPMYLFFGICLALINLSAAMEKIVDSG
jgi:teichuronic acid biosynthesis protein TuaE